MSWLDYPTYFLLTVIFWGLAIVFLITPRNSVFQKLKGIFLLLGLASIVTFAVALWVSLERPPLRTLAETRLWYGVILGAISIVLYYRWRYSALLVINLLFAILFLFLNYLYPDTFDKTLMPALQSPWFIPHVSVYIISYAFLAASSLVGIYGLYLHYKGKEVDSILLMADNIVYIGFVFLTFGLLFGGLWAKEAWGHYWTWDPKETWAFLTWLVYLIYIHLRLYKKQSQKAALWIVALAFIVVLICWFGVNVLPSAQSSVHTYSS